MIINNVKIQNYINNINIQDLSLNLINKIIPELNNNELKIIDKEISKINQNLNHEAKEEEIISFNPKKIKIYKEFILISQKLFNNYISNIFNIKLEKKIFHLFLLIIKIY